MLLLSYSWKTFTTLEAYETVNVTDDTPEGREQAERKSRFSALREAAEND